jgi:hypothetical protein
MNTIIRFLKRGIGKYLAYLLYLKIKFHLNQNSSFTKRGL